MSTPTYETVCREAGFAGGYHTETDDTGCYAYLRFTSLDRAIAFYRSRGNEWDIAVVDPITSLDDMDGALLSVYFHDETDEDN
jgi:hypothetical protein